MPSLGDKKCWNNEQISDFVRKLGFLDQGKEEGKQIKRFLHINEVMLFGKRILLLFYISNK